MADGIWSRNLGWNPGDLHQSPLQCLPLSHWPFAPIVVHRRAALLPASTSHRPLRRSSGNLLPRPCLPPRLAWAAGKRLFADDAVAVGRWWAAPIVSLSPSTRAPGTAGLLRVPPPPLAVRHHTLIAGPRVDGDGGGGAGLCRLGGADDAEEDGEEDDAVEVGEDGDGEEHAEVVGVDEGQRRAEDEEHGQHRRRQPVRLRLEPVRQGLGGAVAARAALVGGGREVSEPVARSILLDKYKSEQRVDSGLKRRGGMCWVKTLALPRLAEV